MIIYIKMIFRLKTVSHRNKLHQQIKNIYFAIFDYVTFHHVMTHFYIPLKNF